MNVLTVAILAQLTALIALLSCLLSLKRQRDLLTLFGGHLELAQVHSTIIQNLNERLTAVEKEPWK